MTVRSLNSREVLILKCVRLGIPGFCCSRGQSVSSALVCAGLFASLSGVTEGEMKEQGLGVFFVVVVVVR